jgi:hypothetical protein
MARDSEKMISLGHSHRWNEARRKHWILTYVSPQEFVSASDAGATALFFGYFKTKKNYRSPVSGNKL